MASRPHALSPRDMKNQIKTILLLGVLSSILIGFGAMLGRQWVTGFTLLALALNLGAYFFSHKIVLRMHGAQPVEEHQAPRLYAIIRELATRAEVPMPRVYLIPSMQPNAFATGRNPKHGVVAVTQGILQLLDLRELRGVLAHEIGHIRNRDILVSTIAAAVAGAIAYIANMLQFTAIFGGVSDDDDGASPIAALGLAIVARSRPRSCSSASRARASTWPTRRGRACRTIRSRWPALWRSSSVPRTSCRRRRRSRPRPACSSSIRSPARAAWSGSFPRIRRWTSACAACAA
jgi:Peptidase family M48